MGAVYAFVVLGFVLALFMELSAVVGETIDNIEH